MTERFLKPIHFLFEVANCTQRLLDVSAHNPINHPLNLLNVFTHNSVDQSLQNSDPMFAIHAILAGGTCAVGRQILRISATKDNIVWFGCGTLYQEKDQTVFRVARIL